MELKNNSFICGSMDYILAILLIYLTIKQHMNNSEAAAAIRGIGTQLEKAKTEITSKITDLETKLAAAGEVSQEVQDAINAVKTSTDALDNIVPDAPETPTEEAK